MVANYQLTTPTIFYRPKIRRFITLAVVGENAAVEVQNRCSPQSFANDDSTNKPLLPDAFGASKQRSQHAGPASLAGLR
jgi:hypothetical protein